MSTRLTPGRPLQLLQYVQRAVVHRGGEDDLGAGAAQLLELQDQLLELHHAAAADLDQEGILPGDMVALHHLAAVLQQVEQPLPLGRRHRQADQRVDVQPPGRPVEHHRVPADDAVRLQLVDAAGDGGAGQGDPLGDLLDGHPGVVRQKGKDLAVEIIHACCTSISRFSRQISGEIDKILF